MDMPVLPMRVLLQIVVLATLSLFASSLAWAQPGKEKDPLSWDRNVARLFSRHCYSCHGTDDPSGDVDLASDVDVGKITSSRGKWLRVLAMLESKQMPPEDERQPSQEDRELMVRFLEETLNNIDCEALKDPGKPVLRRLNRTEYDNVVLDITGLDLRLAEDFPPDPLSYGFDNIGDALSVTPTQVEVMHTAAKSVVASLQKAEGNRLHSAMKAVQNRQQARKFLTSFAGDAFRRPADGEYVQRLLQIYDKATKSGESSEQSLGHAMTAVLISPKFLMRVEQDRRDSQEAFFAIDDYELASRLSFFLWSRGPDDELLQLAKKGALSDEAVLRQQVSRMLGDSRSMALVDNFFGQWLGIREARTHAPDSSVFPEFDDGLRQSMISEVRLFLGEIVREDLPVTALLDADFTFMNPRLAAHYGLTELKFPEGDTEFKRVDLKDRQRGGILTSAAFLMVQSDPGRTNIPRRGNFIAAELLGDAPPPPPPGVPPLEATDDGKQRSLRETFELHRSADECKGCHAKIDPIGFSLENYDAIGRFRTEDRGFPIDSAAEIPGFEAFHGSPGLKDYLLSQRESVLHMLSTKLMIYALGRGLQTSDECVVQAMLAAASKSELKFSSLVSELVVSVPFTHRRNVNY